MFRCEIKSKESDRISFHRSCWAALYTKSSCNRFHFDDCSNNMAHYLCLCQWLFSIKKCNRHIDMCHWTNSHIFHLFWKLKSFRYRGIHSINCHLYWNISHCSFNLEFRSSKFKCFHNDSVCWYNIFGSLHFCICYG